MKTPQWLVRAPQHKDLAALTAIAAAVSQPIAHIQPKALHQADGRFWVIAQQHQIIGYALLLPLPGLPYLFEISGGISPAFQRQTAGRFLWQTIEQAIRGTAVQQITYTVNSLDTPAAHFLRQCGFAPEHEEWTLCLNNLAVMKLMLVEKKAQLKQISQETAVHTLPALYDHCFAKTPWYQPYSAAEVAATWASDDELYYLREDEQDIGFVWLHFPQASMAEIEPIGIVQEKQGGGYGRFLLNHTLHQLQKNSIQTVTLGVWAKNHSAIRLYQSVGFRHSSSNYSLTYSLNSS